MKRLLLTAALALGAVACGSTPPTACRVVHPNLVGADYTRGVWTRNGVVIGNAAQEDSIITADCGGMTVRP